MQSHKINIQNHVHIIGRQDGVTGDTIKADDEVVFCAACQSVFLKDSWEYMNREHCGQHRTLSTVPKPTEQLVMRKEEVIIYEHTEGLDYFFIKMIKEIIMFGITNIYLIFASIVVVLMWMLFPSNAFRGQKTEFTSFLSVIVLFVTYLFKPTWPETYSKKIRDSNFLNYQSRFKMSNIGISVDNHLYYYNQIEKITTKKLGKQYKLLIELKDKSTHTKYLSIREYEQIRPIYIGLASVANSVDVHFHTNNRRERGLLRSIQQKYEGNIWVTDNIITN
ncbi:hypothetical protein [Bernardetia sp.]|uniref:hypothetical protein n=1 Tax=Bernardetia sp. TaxID=1937974 RepID=UPI0025C65EA8|nr:hypothetical protein [Bernardetia sp.]